MMKKIYTLFAMLLLVSFTFAQVNQIQQMEINGVPGTPLKKINTNINSKTPTDTILMDGFTGTSYRMSVTNWYGWMFGTSWRNVDTLASNACAQGYIVYPNSTYNLEEVLIWTFMKHAVSASGSPLIVTVNALDDSSHYGNTSAGTHFDIVCPGPTVLGSTSVPYNSIDTTGFTTAVFTPSIPITSDYAVVVDVADFYLNDDTVGFMCGDDGTATNTMGIEYTWWKYHTTTSDFWAQASHIFGAPGNPSDHAIAFWPVVDKGTSGINSHYYFEGLKMSQNRPNPVFDHTIIDYALENNSKNVNLTIYDANGRVVFKANQGSQTSGQYSIKVNTTNFASGKYYYSLTADGNRLTKKMIITK